MKILYHHRTLARDGMSVHISEMVAALERRGHEVLVVGPGVAGGGEAAGSSPSRPVADLRRYLPAVLNEPAEIAYNIHAYRRLQAAHAAFRPDVLYERDNLFLLAGAWLSRRKDLPRILEVNAPLSRERAEHGRLYWPGVAAKLEASSWRSAEAVLPVTHVLADFVRRAGVPAGRIHVIPNGVDPRRFKPDADGSAVRDRLRIGDGLVLGFTGFVRPWHGLDQVIAVVAEHGERLNLHLLVVGDGPARPDLERQAADRAIGHRVHFVGAEDRSEIPAYVAAFDIALQPSAVAYACPLKLVEYMAMGKAIIAPAQPNIRELVEDGKTALLVGGEGEASLGDAIISLASDGDLRRRLGSAALETARARGMTWDENARRVEELAKAVADRSRSIVE